MNTFQEPYTYQMPDEQRLINEYQTCTELWLETASEYWCNRTENAIRKLEEIGVLAPLTAPLIVSTFETKGILLWLQHA